MDRHHREHMSTFVTGIRPVIKFVDVCSFVVVVVVDITYHCD